jgi:DNA-directed RNA polymerase specialized sigma24 family protein
MKIFAGASAKEIAEALGVSTRTVESDWANAKRTLRRLVSGAST